MEGSWMSLRLNAIIIKDNGVSARGSCRDPSQLAPLISSSCRQRAYTAEMPLVIQCAVPRRVYACTYKTCILPGVILRAPRAHTYVCTYVFFVLENSTRETNFPVPRVQGDVWPFPNDLFRRYGAERIEKTIEGWFFFLDGSFLFERDLSFKVYERLACTKQFLNFFNFNSIDYLSSRQNCPFFAIKIHLVVGKQTSCATIRRRKLTIFA